MTRNPIKNVAIRSTQALLIICVFLSAPVRVMADIVAGPWAYPKNPTEVTVVWELDHVARPVFINYGDATTTKYQKQKVDAYEGDGTAMYKTLLTGLKPDTLYWYFIDYKTESPLFSFRTPRLRFLPPTGVSVEMENN